MSDGKVVDIHGQGKLEKLPQKAIIPPEKRLLTPTEDEELFRAELKTLDVQYDYTTQGFSLQENGQRQNVKPHSLFDRIRVRGKVEASQNFDLLELYLRLWTEDEERKVRVAVQDRLIKVDAEKGQKELAKFLSLVCREGEDLSQVIMTQFIWLVRRKLWGLETVSHVMPILQGAQGGGKSTVISMFLAPLMPLVSKWDVNQITDERNYLELERTFVGYAEEMAGMQGKALAKLKSIITADYENVRLFNTQKRTRVSVNATFMGDTNGHVRDIIKDTTGGRRFWEIRCRDEMDLDALKKINFNLIWRSVSETDPCPTQSSEHFGMIKKLQSDKIRHQSTTRMWYAEQVALRPGEHPVKIINLYDLYRSWCSNNRELAASIQVWGREMTDLGYHRKQCRFEGKVARAILVSPEHPLVTKKDK